MTTASRYPFVYWLQISVSVEYCPSYRLPIKLIYALYISLCSADKFAFLYLETFTPKGR